MWNKKQGDFSRAIHILILDKTTSPKMLFSVEFASYFIFLILLGLLEPIGSGHNIDTSVSGLVNSSVNAANGSVNGSGLVLANSSVYDHSRVGMVCLILFCVTFIPWTFSFGIVLPSWVKRNIEDGTLSWYDGRGLGYKTKMLVHVVGFIGGFEKMLLVFDGREFSWCGSCPLRLAYLPSYGGLVSRSGDWCPLAGNSTIIHTSHQPILRLSWPLLCGRLPWCEHEHSFARVHMHAHTEVRARARVGASCGHALACTCPHEQW